MVVVCAGALCAAVAGCGDQQRSGASTARPSGPRPIVVPIRVRWASFGARPLVEVRVGNGPKVPVLLDTGSTGLHMYAPGARVGSGSGVRVTGRRDAITFLDGMTERGVMASARVTIGRVTTRGRVPFGLINHIGCVRELPRCPGAAGIAGLLARREFGILGIGLARDGERLPNPLLALTSRHSRRWSIALHGASGRLTVRARVPAHPIARFGLARERHRGRTPTWKQETEVCWGAVGLRGAGCQPTVFDSGSTTMLWFGGRLGHTKTYLRSILVNPGTYVAAWARGAARPFWSFTAGYGARNALLAVRARKPLVIASVQAFLKLTITYDDGAGEVLLSPRWQGSGPAGPR